MTPLHEIPAVRALLVPHVCALSVCSAGCLVAGPIDQTAAMNAALTREVARLDQRTRLIAHFLRLGEFAEDPWAVGESAPRLVWTGARLGWQLEWLGVCRATFGATSKNQTWIGGHTVPALAAYTHQRDALAAAEAILRAVLGEAAP